MLKGGVIMDVMNVEQAKVSDLSWMEARNRAGDERT